MTSSILSKSLIILLFIVQISISSCAAAAGQTNKPSSSSLEKALTERIKGAPPEKLRRGKVQAARKLQANLARALAIMSKKNSVPPKVRQSAQRVSAAMRTGQMTNAVVECLPYVMTHVPAGATPGTQLEAIVTDVMPYAPGHMQSPLQGLLEFIKANLNGVNTLLAGTLQGTADLLQGVVATLAGTLGGLNEALIGSVDSLHNLVGGLLCCPAKDGSSGK